MLDASMLSKWVRYYTNNWRVSAAQIQTVRSALAQCYWQGYIAWSELLRCERLLSKAPPQTPCELYPANDLVTAISLIGKTVKNRYKLVDIQGFVDQGIIFKAHKESEVVSLLCDTSQTPGSPIYTELFLLEGQPLSVWIASQYPMGLPSAMANVLLQQIYQMLAGAKRKDEWIDSVHIGQFFIAPDTLQLQHIPYSLPVQPYMRGQMYLGENSGYRLIAVAYELMTGCVPGELNQIPNVLKACKNLQQWQKQQIERCLLGKRSISLAKAALILNANKKYVYRDTALLALASMFAMAAVIWQTMNYAPDLFASLPKEIQNQTIVLEEGTKDKHVNLLKAAFFTQIEEKNFQGAKVSWQALQNILPADDIFIKKIGPELLASEVIEPKVRAAEPVTLVEPETVVNIPDVLVPLPPLPKTAPDLDVLIESVIKADPCDNTAACTDLLSNKEQGPRLLVKQTATKEEIVMTQQTISVEDYNKYCEHSKNCTSLEHAPGLDLELSEIQNTVEDYNTYCLSSGLCSPLMNSAEPLRELSVSEIQKYAAWLSEETGYSYRLPTADEWREMSANFKDAEALEWVLNDEGRVITTSELDTEARKKRYNDNEISFRLVRESKS